MLMIMVIAKEMKHINKELCNYGKIKSSFISKSRLDICTCFAFPLGQVTDHEYVENLTS